MTAPYPTRSFDAATTSLHVLVIGGGIGGLSTTLALRRQGFDVDVVERDPEWGVYGVGIIQPGNALRALESLGLAEACVESGAPIRGDRTWLVWTAKLMMSSVF